MKRDSYSTFFVFAIFLIAAILRLTALGRQSLWLDEFTSIEVATKSFHDIIAGKGFDQATPPFYYIALHFWLTIFGVSEVGLRSFSVFTDLLSLALLVSLAAKILPRAQMLLAAFIYAISPFAVYYAQEGRMYSLLTLLCLGTFTIFVDQFFVERKWCLFRLIVLVMVGVMGAYTHYYYSLVLIALTFTALLIEKRPSRQFLEWFACCIIIALCFAPWIGVVLRLAGAGGQQFREHYLTVIPYAFFRFFAGYGIFPLTSAAKGGFAEAVKSNVVTILLYTLPAAFILTRTLFSRALSREKKLFLFMPAIVVVSIAVIISAKVPMLSERYLTSIYPLVVLGVAASPAFGSRALLAIFVILLATGSSSYSWNSEFGKEGWRQVAEFLAQSNPEKLPIVIDPPYCRGIFEYYHGASETAPMSGRSSIVPTGAFFEVVRGKGSGDVRTGGEVILHVPFENGITVKKHR